MPGGLDEEMAVRGRREGGVCGGPEVGDGPHGRGTERGFVPGVTGGQPPSHRALREYHVYLMDCVLCTYLTVWGFVLFCFLNCTLFVLIRGVKEQFNVNYCWQY